MKESANILEFVGPRHSLRKTPEPAREIPHPAPRSNARLRVIPKPLLLSRQCGETQAKGSSTSATRFFDLAIPECFRLLHPSMLGQAVFDGVLVLCVFWAASHSYFPGVSGAAFGFYVTLFFVFAAQAGLYRAGHKAIGAECKIIIKAIAWATFLTGLARHEAPVVLIVSCTSACLLIATRWLHKSSGSTGAVEQTNVLIVGDSKLARSVADTLDADVPSQRCVRSFLPECHFHGGYGPLMLRRIAREERIDEVFITSGDAEVTETIIRAAHDSHLDVVVVPSFEISRPVDFERVGGLPLFKIHAPSLPEWQLAGKRIVDLVLASAALVVLSPLMLLIAIIIKLDSPGPALYRSIRVGQRARRFLCFKFRTMTARADAEKDSLRSRNEREGAFFKILHDPRITRVGAFLRRYSFDELPQLWNVVLGDMSLVGPRPHPPDDVERYSVEHLRRLDFIPGMTGLWQVTARQDPSFERCVALDIEYIKSWSPLLDLRILCRTVAAVLQGSGA